MDNIKYNNELQNIDNFNKAYLLGFFYSDGNVSTNQEHSRIQLHMKDEEILLKIKEAFPFFRIYKDSKRNKVILQSSINKVRLDLINNGCLYAKSFINKENLKIPIYENILLYKHFIRGFFDGDGGCTLTQLNNKRIQKRVYIYSGNLNLINEIKTVLENFNINTSIDLNPKPKNTGFSKNSIVYKLTISTSSYKDFYKLLYENADLFMLRKKLKFEKILNETNFFIKAINLPNCKFCNSDNIVKNGIDKFYKSQRFLCKSCKKNFLLLPLSLVID